MAADMVSFWICISVPFFDLRSAGGATGFPNREPPTPEEDCCCDDAPAVEVADGSEVMRSISVVPDESCPEAMVAERGAARVGDLRRARGLSVWWDFSGRVARGRGGEPRDGGRWCGLLDPTAKLDFGMRLLETPVGRDGQRELPSRNGSSSL